MKKTVFSGLLVLCALPFVNTVMALVAGILFSLTVGNPWPGRSSTWSRNLLQLSVVGLGFGQSLGQVWQVGRGSIGYTVVGISLTLLVGMLLGRIFRTDRKTSALISFGTAICGGSAIAAMAPVIKAKDEESALALATVFTLNAVALVAFPVLGHMLGLGQHQFGIWAGLAIHDTSSVVGAATAYGAEALDIATTVKLTRAMWIAPIALGTAAVMRSDRKVGLPLFIVGFVAAAALRTALPQMAPVWIRLATVARQALVVTLFLIGAGLTKDVLKTVGIRPLAQGVCLWLIVSVVTLTAILQGVIS